MNYLMMALGGLMFGLGAYQEFFVKKVPAVKKEESKKEEVKEEIKKVKVTDVPPPEKFI